MKCPACGHKWAHGHRPAGRHTRLVRELIATSPRQLWTLKDLLKELHAKRDDRKAFYSSIEYLVRTGALKREARGILRKRILP